MSFVCLLAGFIVCVRFPTWNIYLLLNCWWVIFNAIQSVMINCFFFTCTVNCEKEGKTNTEHEKKRMQQQYQSKFDWMNVNRSVRWRSEWSNCHRLFAIRLKHFLYWPNTQLPAMMRDQKAFEQFAAIKIGNAKRQRFRKSREKRTTTLESFFVFKFLWN